MPLEKPLESITEEDIKDLERNQIPEGVTIDYKEQFILATPEGRKDFLANVTSFANASGGHLLFGIREDSGVPVGIPGIDIKDKDQLHQDIQNLVRDGVAPRMQVHIHVVSLVGGKSVLIIRIPKSWAAPHRIEAAKDYRFMSRASHGKFPMDVPQIRRAFLMGEGFSERVREFRVERLLKVQNGESPVLIDSDAAVVVHLVPANAFDPELPFNSKAIARAGEAVRDNLSLKMSPPDIWRNLDGLVLSDISKSMRISGKERANWYYQLFMNGAIEAVCPIISDDNKFVNVEVVEVDILLFALHLLKGSLGFGNDGPVFIMASLVNVDDMKISFKRQGRWQPVIPVDRPMVMFPEVRIDSASVEAELLATKQRTGLQPICDMLWHACGYANSHRFKQDGSLTHDLI